VIRKISELNLVNLSGNEVLNGCFFHEKKFFGVSLFSCRFEAIDFLYPLGAETYSIYISNPDQEEVRRIVLTIFVLFKWKNGFMTFKTGFLKISLFLFNSLYYGNKDSIYYNLFFIDFCSFYSLPD